MAYGFGGGYGTAAQKGRAGTRPRRGKPTVNGDSGLGGGGGMRVIPAGMFEVSPAGARFLPVRSSLPTTALTLVGGALVGRLLARRAESAHRR